MPSVNYAIITIGINGVTDQMIVEKTTRQHDVTEALLYHEASDSFDTLEQIDKTQIRVAQQ